MPDHEFTLTPPTRAKNRGHSSKGKNRRLHGGRILDIAGKRFGHWTVLGSERFGTVGRYKRRLSMWRCRCDCGYEGVRPGSMLTTGSSTNCGCVRVQQFTQRMRGKCLPGAAAQRVVLNEYKRGASERGLVWELTAEQFTELTQQDCVYCGQSPSRTHRCVPRGKKKRTEGNGVFIYNGIDRLDSAHGYTVGNVVPCCTLCNRAKSDLALKAFQEWIDRLVVMRHKVITSP